MLSARFPSPQTPPHPAPSCCPPTRWPHFREAFSLRRCPAVAPTHPSPCPTPGPTRERAALTSGTAAPGETQQAQQRVIWEKVELSTDNKKGVASFNPHFFYPPCSTPFRGPSSEQVFSSASSCLPCEFFFHLIFSPSSEQHQGKPVYLASCPYSRAGPVL